MKKLLLITTFLFSISLHAESMSARYDNEAQSARKKTMIALSVLPLCIIRQVNLHCFLVDSKPEPSFLLAVYEILGLFCLLSPIYYFGKEKAFAESKKIALKKEKEKNFQVTTTPKYTL